jgi:FkbM family methyltransferase
MNKSNREILKQKVMQRYELFKLNHSRVRRFLKEPWRTFKFYVLATISYIKPFKISARTLWGDIMTYYLPEGNAIYYYGFFEANLTNFFVNYFREGDVFVDVGAHVGFYSTLVSSLIGETGKVYSFEPTPRTFISLKENTKNKKNVIVNNFAVLNEKKDIEFIDYGPCYSAFNGFKKRTSLNMNFLKRDVSSITVKTIVLDNYCESNKIKPDFIKIDAEGAEYLILQGMDNLLMTSRPVISIEVAGEEEWQENCQKSINFLLDHNYLPFEISTEGKLIEHEIKENYLYDNLIFIPKEKVDFVKNKVL